MNRVGTIKLRNLEELVSTNNTTSEQHVFLADARPQSPSPELQTLITTPVKSSQKSAFDVNTPTTSKKSKKTTEDQKTITTTSKTAVKPRIGRTLKKELPPDQKTIDSFFKSSSKTYRIEKEKELSLITTIGKENKQKQRQSGKGRAQASSAKKSKTTANRRVAGRKRLFIDDSTETETTSYSGLTSEMTTPPRNRKRKTPAKATAKKITTKKKKKCKQTEEQTKIVAVDCINLCSDSDEDEKILQLETNLSTPIREPETMPVTTSKFCTIQTPTAKHVSTQKSAYNHASTQTPENAQHFSLQQTPIKYSKIGAMLPTPSSTCNTDSAGTSDVTSTKSISAVAAIATRIKKRRSCPPYKVVDGSTFAVDAFQFGEIPNVTHYFLTHFHADHYVGLTRKFAKPLYLSSVTARLVREFIPLNEQYLHELELHQPLVIEEIEVTAIDANHCPGAIMLIFKFSTGKCILHTGDFRACAEMESEPIFWNNDIDIIYLDTTYFSDKYSFCTQHESIDRASQLVSDFQEKHQDKRILYVCGSYVIGKEKFWSALADKFKLSVWTEDNRRRALNAMQLESYQKLLCDEPLAANMHVISMGKLGFWSLVEYFEPFSTHYDILLAIRPSGWEKNSKPKYGKKINIIGVEYSEHSSYSEMERFVKYLKPRVVISTVPVARDLCVTAKVPDNWYKYDKLSSMQRNFQPSITSYLKLKNIRNTSYPKAAMLNTKPPKYIPKPSILESLPVNDQLDNSPEQINYPKKNSPMKSTPVAIAGSPIDVDAEDDWIS